MRGQDRSMAAPYMWLRKSRKRKARMSPGWDGSAGRDWEKQRKARKPAKHRQRQTQDLLKGFLPRHPGLSPPVSVLHKVPGGGKRAPLNPPVTAMSLKTRRQQQQKLTALREAGSHGRTRRLEASLQAHHAVAASNTPSMASHKLVHTSLLSSSRR